MWCPLGICQGVVCLVHTVDLFLAFKVSHTDFHSGYTSLQSYQQFDFPNTLHHLLLVVLLIIAILTWVRWNLNIVFLTCISLIAKDNKHFWDILQPLHSTFENSFFQIPGPIFIYIHSLFFNSLHIWDISPLFMKSYFSIISLIL